MVKHLVVITETLQRTIEVEASDIQSALDQVKHEYYEGLHVLSADDFVSAEFSADTSIK